MTIGENIFINLLSAEKSKINIVHKSEIVNVGRKWIEALKVRAISNDTNVVALSGGNQQKVVVARSLVQEPKLVIFDEPTRGVDVGAIADLHQIINDLADGGIAVVVISSYLPEILSLSDRILVTRQGRVVEEFSAGQADEERIMYAAVH
jgi:simple sugar transport system ATP-binding protein